MVKGIGMSTVFAIQPNQIKFDIIKKWHTHSVP